MYRKGNAKIQSLLAVAIVSVCVLLQIVCENRASTPDTLVTNEIINTGLRHLESWRSNIDLVQVDVAFGFIRDKDRYFYHEARFLVRMKDDLEAAAFTKMIRDQRYGSEMSTVMSVSDFEKEELLKDLLPELDSDPRSYVFFTVAKPRGPRSIGQWIRYILS